MLNKTEASELPDTEFKAMVIKKLNELTVNHQKLQRNQKEHNVNYIKMKNKVETINKGQEELKNTISEQKNTLEGMKSRLGEAEDGMCELEDKVEKNTQKEQEKKRG